MESESEERGPLEQEMYETLRMDGYSIPELLSAQFEGRDALTNEQWINVLQRVSLSQMQAILRLAKEIDQLRLSRE